MIDTLPPSFLFFSFSSSLTRVHRALWDLSTSLFSQMSVIPSLTYTRLVAKLTMFSSRAKQNISIIYTHTYQLYLKCVYYMIECVYIHTYIHTYIHIYICYFFCIYKNLIKSILYNLREFLFFTKLCSYPLN